MDRRDFLKASAITGATAALDSCGKPERQLIRFIPEEDLVPGVAVWKPSVCTLCPAGCGTIVRVMEGEAEVVRHGELGLLRMGLAKKIEGNPQHPISQGRLCPRGEAGLQITYHPDRLKNPLKRTGPRGSGQFQEVSWDDALKELVSQLAALRDANESSALAFLMRPLRGQRRDVIDQFLKAFGAPPAITFEFLDDAVLRHANLLSFGRPQLPTLDLAQANYVISFGADLLGTWNSPVAQSVAYGEMRQGRPGRRGKLVHVESRLSLTGASADEWIPVRPGTEGVLALGLAHVILQEKLAPPPADPRPGALLAGWSQGLPDYRPESVTQRTGVPATTVIRLARELAAHGPSVSAIGGASLAHTNGLFNALAVNALNSLLGAGGSADRPGLLVFAPVASPPAAMSAVLSPDVQGNFSVVQTLVQDILLSRPHAPKVLLLYGANPAFALPPGVHVREALEKVPFVASFDNFLDETSSMADLILPDHSPLESWLDDAPQSGSSQAVASLSPPAMRPLYGTRATPDVLLEIAQQLGGSVSEALPWKSYEEALRARFENLRKNLNSSQSPEDFWKNAQEQGGWWGELRPAGLSASMPPHRGRVAPPEARAPLALTEAQFDGSNTDFPFYFQPFASQMFYDGSLAHLPWMQEAPDPLATAMWGTWVEINPRTAERLGVQQGDLVEIESQNGKLQAPALLTPGIAPDVFAMPVGQGHETFTRYASGRGANPLAILAPMVEPETGAFAWAATRVKIRRAGKGRLVLFAAEIREKPYEQEHR